MSNAGHAIGREQESIEKRLDAIGRAGLVATLSVVFLAAIYFFALYLITSLT